MVVLRAGTDNAWFDWITRTYHRGGLTELDFQMQRWVITPHGILSREGYINRRTYIVDREKVQSVYRSENPLLQLLGLSQVIIRVAGSIVRLPLLPKSKAETVLESLTEDWRK